MELLQILLDQEQQAVSLVGGGFLSLILAFSLARFTGAERSIKRTAFWLSQVILVTSGAAIILWPSSGYIALTSAVAISIALLLYLNLKVRPGHDGMC